MKPIEVIDDAHGQLYDTVDEAIAVCRALSEPGDEIAIHYADCEIDADEQGCTCEPIVVVAGERVTS